MGMLGRWTAPASWIVVPHDPGARLVHVRALHFVHASDFITLGADLCALDRDGAVTVHIDEEAHPCPPQDLPELARRLAAFPRRYTSIHLSGQALRAGPWQVCVSADPTRPSFVQADAGKDHFARALAGLVHHASRAHTFADLRRRRPLLPPR